MQDCLALAIAERHLWQPGTKLRAWLFTILHHAHVNRLRRVKCEEDRTRIAVVALTPVPRKPDDRLELRDLDRAIDNLPEDQRRVLPLVGLEGLEYAMAASILGLPVGALRSRLGRARHALRKELSRPGRQPFRPSVSDVAVCTRTRGARVGRRIPVAA